MCFFFSRLQHHDDSHGLGERSRWSIEHERLVLTLSIVGRPMIEAALSTVICMMPLFFVGIYVVTSFAKTVLCVGAIGLLHGLFIVPVLLAAPSPLDALRRRQRKRRATDAAAAAPLADNKRNSMLTAISSEKTCSTDGAAPLISSPIGG